MKRTIERTADGSATLFVPELDEHYHSVKGAETESRHIFIEQGLNASTASQPHLLEIGFGTGLNAWLTLKATQESLRKVHYTALELYPLSWELVKGLDYTDHLLFESLHTAPWEQEVSLTSHFTLKKRQADFTRATTLHTEERYDLIYFDAFAPEKQPEMWTQELFDRLYVILNNGGILTTYCAKGAVRRMLQAAGFIVERLPGPPGGKREILRGTKRE